VWKLRSGVEVVVVVVNADVRYGGCCGCALRRHEHERAPARMPAVGVEELVAAEIDGYKFLLRLR
jgi:hypothetical protein